MKVKLQRNFNAFLQYEFSLSNGMKVPYNPNGSVIDKCNACYEGIGLRDMDAMDRLKLLDNVLYYRTDFKCKRALAIKLYSPIALLNDSVMFLKLPWRAKGKGKSKEMGKTLHPIDHDFIQMTVALLDNAIIRYEDEQRQITQVIPPVDRNGKLLFNMIPIAQYGSAGTKVMQWLAANGVCR